MRHEKVWDSGFLKNPRLTRSIDFFFPGEDSAASRDEFIIDLKRRYKIGSKEDLSIEEYPEHAFFRLKGIERKKNALGDIAVGYNGFVVVSGAFFDVLQLFNLGKTRFKQIPLRGYDRETPIPGRWYFAQFRENRNCFVPAQSNGIRSQRGPNSWTIYVDTKYQLAVNPSAAEDLDMWGDSSAIDMMFFSDRLRKAIKDAGLDTRGMSFRRCKVV